jgi:hypothetical protein
MAVISLFAPMARSTNRSTPTMANTGHQLQNVTAKQRSLILINQEVRLLAKC